MAKRDSKFRNYLIFVAIFATLVYFLKHWRRWSELVAIRWSKKRYDASLSKGTRQKKKVLQASTGPFEKMSTDKLKELVDIWHNGIADRFTSYGSLVKGVPPDGKQAVLAYEELMKRGESSICLAYARLSEFGVPNDSNVINRNRALALNLKHYESLTDLYERYDSLEAVERLSPPGMIFQVTALRSDIAGRMAALAREDRRNAAQTRRAGYATDMAGTDCLMAGPPGLRNRLAVNQLHGEAWVQNLPFDAFRAQNANGGAHQVGDRQNVHDSTVTRTVTASVDKLRNQDNDKIDTGSSISDVRNMIRHADISPDKRAHAILALESIEKNDQLNSATGITETELLRLVWNRVHHGDNSENQKALRENLVDELSACVENGGTVCSTGRFTHILGTLNGVDDAVSIKPGWALSKELVERAGVMYKDKIEALPEEDRVAVEAVDPNEEQQTKNNVIMDQVRMDLRTDFKRAYVDAGIMTQEGLDVELNKWIDHIG